MRHLAVLASFVALSGCSHLWSGPEPSKPAAQSPARAAQSSEPHDSLCMSDCMSDQASEQLCRRRCTY